MLRLTEELGQVVRAGDGSSPGVVLDLTLHIGDRDAVIDRVVIGRRSRPTAIVSWSGVQSFEHDLLQLRTDAEVETASRGQEGELLGLAPDEILLVRDVLDTQIVDVDGQRLVRVGDVLLARLPQERLRVVAVDVGTGAVVRRLGLRRTALRFAEEAVAWDSLHLTSARGHVVQLATTKATVHRLDAASLAVLLAQVTTESASDVLSALPPPVAAAALVASDHDDGRRLVEALPPDRVSAVLAHVPGEHLGRLWPVKVPGLRPRRHRTRLRRRRRRRAPGQQ